MEEAALADLSQCTQRLEVGVVALGLPGERDVHGVVEVVAPLGVEAVAAGFARGDQRRVVEVGLRDQRQRPALVRRERGHLDRHLLEEVGARLVAEGVYGIQSQPVDVMVLQPHPCVVEDVATHLVAARGVEVHQVAPGVRAFLEVRPEGGEVVPGGAEVVVDDVLDDAQPRRVTTVDEALVRRRPAVRLVDGEPQHAVVPPVVDPVERVDGHHLDQVDADRTKVVEFGERGVQRAFRGERSDVQLVDHRAGELAAGPRAVVPLVVRRVERARPPVHAVGLTTRPRVGQGDLPVVDQVPVVGLSVRHLPVGDPPPVRAGSHRHDLVAEAQLDLVGARRPDVEPAACHRSSRASSATGRSARTSASGTAPV